MPTAEEQQKKPLPNWEGMLKRWELEKGNHHRAHSIKNVYEHPLLSDASDHPQWRGKIKEFFMTHERLKYYDICDRVYDLICGFPMTQVEYQNKWNEDLLDSLDELQEYAEFTNVASILHSEGCLFSFLRKVLSNKHAGIRANMAGLVTTMAQYHPTSQQLLIDEKCIQLLLNNFTSDPDETSRTRARRAISSLTWNNESGVTALRKALRIALISGSICRRDVVNLIELLLRENDMYSQEMNLAFCDDGEARGAALRGLLVLARDEPDIL